MSAVPATTPAAVPPPAIEPVKPSKAAAWLREAGSSVGTTALGFGLLLIAWAAASALSVDTSDPAAPRTLLPGPVETLRVLGEMLANPFYDNGPNDKGILLQAFYSLQRVFQGWGLGLLIAIPLGLALGASTLARNVLNPVIQVMRPVSPLAWFPIGLTVLQSSPKATVFVIVITSLWPTLINTLYGVASLPDDFRNVSKVFKFSRWQHISKVLVPYAVPHILTGMRLSMGIAWLVIVAAEMLAGGTGIGYFIWDSYNAGSLTRVLAGILVVGIIGLLLDRLLDVVANRLSYQ
jgi:nitrate/nitrite transport system permease protein